jgi:hypothetical protein
LKSLFGLNFGAREGAQRMADKTRKSGSRSWTRASFALLWIVLGGLSGLYIYTLLTDPAALGGQAAKQSVMPAEEEPPKTVEETPPITADQAAALLEADKTHDDELTEIKTSLRQLSEQLAELNTRLQPIEKFVGPVAALPRSTSVTTSPPEPVVLPQQSPAAAPMAAPPSPSAPAPSAAPAAAPPTEVTPPPAPAAQAPEAPPTEAPASQAAQPEPTTPAEAPAATAGQTAPSDPAPAGPAPTEAAPPETNEAAGAPPSAETEPRAARIEDVLEESGNATAEATPAPEAAESPAPAPQPEADVAALDPVALPPAANDGTTRYGIEIGTVAKQDGLRPLWREFLTNHAALVAGLQPRRVLAPDKKWRLIAGPFANAQEAEAACTLFKKAERPCAPTVYAGDSL